MKEGIKAWLRKQATDEKSVILFLIKGYFLLTLSCFLILMLPWSQQGTLSIVDQIFFATSIVSTTGLAPADFASSYTTFGQVVSLFFIQLGGIGYMALSSFIILKQVSRLPSISVRLLRLEFNLPQRYPLLQFIYSVIIFTILIEVVGAVFLYYGFRNEGMEYPIWNAVFHSISAFCTAGFSLFGDSMTSFKDNRLITTTILVISLLGSIGFIVLLDFWNRLTRKRKRITLTSKIILIATFFICFMSAVLVFISDASLYQSGWAGWMEAVFQSVSAHTTVGFNNYDLGQLGTASIFVLIIVMIVGASPAGTGGGIKTTSATAIYAVVESVLKKRTHILFLGKELPDNNLYLAITTVAFYLLLLILGTWGVMITDGDRLGFANVLFECASALSTVGISTGITGDLSDGGKLLVSLLMFIGRLGVLTFGFVLISEAPEMRRKPQIEDIAL